MVAGTTWFASQARVAEGVTASTDGLSAYPGTPSADRAPHVGRPHPCGHSPSLPGPKALDLARLQEFWPKSIPKTMKSFNPLLISSINQERS